MKGKIKYLMGMLFVLCALSLLPAASAQAATQTLNSKNAWIATSDGYSVKLTTSHNLYYKYNGNSTKISSRVYAAAVCGTKIAYMKSNDADEDYGTPIYIVLYDLKTKERRSCTIDGDVSIESGAMALYDGNIYYSNYDGDCGSFHTGCIKTSTMKAYRNSISKKLHPYGGYANSFYQRGRYLICLEGNAVDEGVARLRIFDLKEGVFTKTISSKCVEFAVVGSRLYYVNKTLGNESTNYRDVYTVRYCTLSGTDKKTFKTFYEAGGFAFHYGKVIVRRWDSRTEDYTFRDYSLSTGSYKNVTENNYYYNRFYYFHCAGEV